MKQDLNDLSTSHIFTFMVTFGHFYGISFLIFQLDNTSAYFSRRHDSFKTLLQSESVERNQDFTAVEEMIESDWNLVTEQQKLLRTNVLATYCVVLSCLVLIEKEINKIKNGPSKLVRSHGHLKKEVVFNIMYVKYAAAKFLFLSINVSYVQSDIS